LGHGDRSRSGAPRAKVGCDLRGLALTETDGHAQLLQILVEGLPAQFDPVAREERPHLRFPFAANQPGDALEEPAERARRVEPSHGLPVALHELPGQPAPPDAREHHAHDVRRVLAADLPVQSVLERLGEKLRLAEPYQRIEVALLLLRAPGVAETFPEL